tara:strand:- start:206 stop:667 length:462 start_codon:yes stop_codon:yes gene_type:complete
MKINNQTIICLILLILFVIYLFIQNSNVCSTVRNRREYFNIGAGLLDGDTYTGGADPDGLAVSTKAELGKWGKGAGMAGAGLAGAGAATAATGVGIVATPFLEVGAAVAEGAGLAAEAGVGVITAGEFLTDSGRWGARKTAGRAVDSVASLFN